MEKRPGDAKTHASIFSEVRVDPSTPDDSDVDEVAMPCMEIADGDDEISLFFLLVYRCTNMRKSVTDTVFIIIFAPL